MAFPATIAGYVPTNDPAQRCVGDKECNQYELAI
jgi:hypothetical protein